MLQQFQKHIPFNPFPPSVDIRDRLAKILF